MYFKDIIEYIIDYELKMCHASVKKEKFLHDKNDNIADFLEQMMIELDNNFYSDCKIISAKHNSIYTMIFGKMHSISLEYNKNTSDYLWSVSIYESIKDESYEPCLLVNI